MKNGTKFIKRIKNNHASDVKKQFDLKRESKSFRQLITEGTQITSFPPLFS